ncbi:hypothetical protein GCM10027059_19680 [Myceligenerans halotolerans]
MIKRPSEPGASCNNPLSDGRGYERRLLPLDPGAGILRAAFVPSSRNIARSVGPWEASASLTRLHALTAVPNLP